MASTKAKKKITKNAKPSARGRAPAPAAKKPAPWPSKGAPTRRGAAKPAAGKSAAKKKPAARTSTRKTSKSLAEKGARKAARPAAKAPKPARALKTVQRAGRASATSRKDSGKQSPAASPARKGPARPVRRYDRPGHLDPRYAAELRRQSVSQEHDPRAFVEEPRAKDDLAEERGEEVVGSATAGGGDEAEEVLDQVVPEEQGGPFVETNAADEFAHDTDASNPKDAKREPFPTT